MAKLPKAPNEAVRLLRIRLNGMKQRCYNPNEKRYKHYGGRGITVCDEWLDNADSFVKWSLENGYKEGLTIDRRDNNKGYSPNNCRWITNDEQQYNKSNNVVYEFNGQSHSIIEWSKILNMDKKALESRFRRGWSVEKVFTTPIKVQTIAKYLYNGQEYTCAELSKKFDIDRKVLHYRLKSGWSIEDAIKTDIIQPKKYIMNGMEKTASEWANCFGLDAHMVQSRLNKGWTIEEAIADNKYTINGVTHTVNEWCEIYGALPLTVFLKLSYGWSIEKALTEK